MRRPYLIGSVMLGISLLLLLSTVNTAAKEQIEVPFSTGAGVSGQVSLTLPTEFYAGDDGKINLSIDLVEPVDFSTVSLIVHLEAGFDFIEPTGSINVNLLNPEPVHLEWRLRTVKAGDYPGTLWIWADASEGKELVMAKEFRVRSKLYLGARVSFFRIAYGIMGAMAIAWLLGVIFRFKRIESEKK